MNWISIKDELPTDGAHIVTYLAGENETIPGLFQTIYFSRIDKRPRNEEISNVEEYKFDYWFLVPELPSPTYSIDDFKKELLTKRRGESISVTYSAQCPKNLVEKALIEHRNRIEGIGISENREKHPTITYTLE